MTKSHEPKAADAITDAILAAIVTISADAIVCVDDSQRIIFFNEGAATVFGYTAAEVMGQPLELLIPERFRGSHAKHVESFGKSSVVARRMGERGQISGLRKNGQEFPAEAAISHLGASDPRVFTVVLRDVTERKHAHETQQFLAEAGEILASSLGLEETFRNVARLAVPRLADACIVNVNQDGAFERTAVAHVDEEYGRELERKRQQHPIDASGDHPVAVVLRSLSPLILSAASTGLKADREHPELTDIFNALPSDAIILPLRARDQLLGVLSLYRKHGTYDPGDVFLAEELGRRAAMAMDNARLHELVHVGVRARDDMIGIVAHDLRNPVNAVRMLAGVILDRERDEPLPAEITDYAAVIRQAAEQMDALIRDLLDVTRVEAGRLKVDAIPYNTEELLSDALRTLSPVAAEKSIVLRLNAPDDMPDVLADCERVRQAMSNLVGNAIKFSPEGSEIVVSVTVLQVEVRFSVADRGNGMTSDQLSHAFDRFWQSSRTDRQGAGLGLAIAKGIIEAHGGRIWAESRPGAGSTFYFTLPIAEKVNGTP
ncbi:MAG: PAS domain-containing sensor histidine kinase [Gemmatimonadales bacterium]